jgi:hypothetical protein
VSFSSPCPALCLRAALQGGIAHARPESGAGVAALILALLFRLFGRTEAARIITPAPTSDATPHPHALIIPAIGRAPHAAVIEAGLVPDWILPGIRNRGMRPAKISPRLRRNTRPARAPPGATPIPP